MSVIFLLIPLSIVIASFFVLAFVWAVRSGQYEDTCTPSMRLLTEESAVERNPRKVVTESEHSIHHERRNIQIR